MEGGCASAPCDLLSLSIERWWPTTGETGVRPPVSTGSAYDSGGRLWSGPEQHLNGAALVHGAVALGNLRHGQFQVEYFAGVDLPVPHQVDQLGQVATHRGGTAVEVNVGEEQSLAVELDPVRDADEGDVPPLARGVDRLHHRFLRPNALKHGVSTNSIGHVHDPGDALVATLSHDVGCAEFACEFLLRG